ncbi:hypothetical protein B0H34DRAFT_809448 [Crassisporium funariophilum]|nr:hypothetical protein B0H34DRAFT_809448 [Crassisporium funariophilum]
MRPCLPCPGGVLLNVSGAQKETAIYPMQGKWRDQSQQGVAASYAATVREMTHVVHVYSVTKVGNNVWVMTENVAFASVELRPASCQSKQYRNIMVQTKKIKISDPSFHYVHRITSSSIFGASQAKYHVFGITSPDKTQQHLIGSLKGWSENRGSFISACMLGVSCVAENHGGLKKKARKKCNGCLERKDEQAGARQGDGAGIVCAGLLTCELRGWMLSIFLRMEENTCKTFFSFVEGYNFDQCQEDKLKRTAANFGYTYRP